MGFELLCLCPRDSRYAGDLSPLQVLVAVKNVKRGAAELMNRVVEIGRHAAIVGRVRVGDTNVRWKDHRLLLFLVEE